MIFNKGKLFAAFLVSASSCVAVLAQTPAPAPRIEAVPQVFTTTGGSYLGVQSQEVTNENFSRFGLREVRGVAVEKVMENSPAAQAGLQNGDVIVRFNGEEVTSVRKLTRMISEVAPDHKVRITVLRNGNEREITATLGKRPAVSFTGGGFGTTVPSLPRIQMNTIPEVMPFPDGRTIVPSIRGGENVFTFGSSRQIGVGVSALNQQLGDYFGVTDGRGVLINNVRENSPAAKAGLRAGDVIVEVDGKAVNASSELTRALNEKKEGDVSLTIIRNKNRQNVRVMPEKGQGGTFRLEDFDSREGRIRNLPRRSFRPTQPRIPQAPRIQVAPRIF